MILIFGNAGSGKSTLARRFSAQSNLAYLDLDTLAWLPGSPPRRAAVEASRARIGTFILSNDSWVVEGCYSDLLAVAVPASNERIDLNLPVSGCIENARNRPWEPHKYPSRPLRMLTSRCWSNG